MKRELKLQNCRLDGRYDLLDCLGRGSYSEIYRARVVNPAPHTDREVVIKALNVFLQGSPETDLERTLIENFQNEALALDRVRHPNIIRRLGHGTALDMGGQPFHYLVLEYLPGGDLNSLCRERPFQLGNTLYYLEQVCAGLAHAHECGIIHRDIKPQNLLLTGDRRTVKIADFGVAKLNIAEEIITRVGTNVYAPPEHSPAAAKMETGNGNPAQRLTPAADIYSLAKTVYTLLAGESPRRFEHYPISDLPSSLMSQRWGPGVLATLRKATQTNPSDRYQNVQDFWRDLADTALRASTGNLPAQEEISARHHISRDLANLPDSALPSAPPRPRFESATALRQEILPQNIDAPNPRARLVVPVGTKTVVPPPVVPDQQPLPPKAQDIIERLPDAQTPRPRGTRRSTRLLVSLLLIMLFVGMLLATNYYVRNYRNKNTNGTKTTKTDPQPPSKTPPGKTVSVGSTGTASTDVNIRSGPGTAYKSNGVIGKDSRIQVSKIGNGGWIQVQITEYKVPSNGKWSDSPPNQGWLNGKTINFDQ